MAKRKRGRPKKKAVKFNVEETGILFAIIFMMAAGVSLVSLFVDAPYFAYIHKYLGWSIPIAVIFFGTLSLRLFGYKNRWSDNLALFGQFATFISLATFLHAFIPYEDAAELAESGQYGGMVGYWVSDFMIDRVSRLGTLVIFSPLLIIFASMGAGLTLAQLRTGITAVISAIGSMINTIAGFINSAFAKGENVEGESQKVPVQSEVEGKRMVGELSGVRSVEKDLKKPEIKEPIKVSTLTGNTKAGIDVEVQKVDDYSNWKLPPTAMLNAPMPQEDSKEDLNKNANIIEQTLDSFGIQARVADISSGPTVTQYALDIAMGTKVSRIKNLAGDLALALAAPSGAVRIEAPIPGTSLVGIEVPNSKPKLVTIREVMESDILQSGKLRLGMALGKNVAGKVEAIDLQKMPHLLLAGSTGSGKSVLINSFLISLLMRMSPADLRLILVDPKMVELSLYNGIPHLLTPVITEMDKVVNSLKWSITEMQRRYVMFKQARVRNIREFNEKELEEHLPYIVIVVDEMADLMMTAGAEVETNVCRLAQMARATGIHLVLATQRPSVNVLTGLIKANIPARIGMSVATSVDSRVILDQIGSETLLGNGDMLYKAPDKNKVIRIQGSWVDNVEIERVIDFIKKQSGEDVEYEETVIESKESDFGGSGGSEDDLFGDSVKFVCAKGKASASMLQRAFRIGYNRAARLLDDLEAQGVVGAANGSKPRDVLIADAERFLSGGVEEEINE